MSDRRIKRGWMNFRVLDIINETHDTKTFILEDADEGGRPWDYYPGQYLTFRFDHITEKPLVRSYSLSSSPCQENIIALTVKAVEHGVVSHWLLDHITIGDVLRARGPMGRFYIDPESATLPVMMIAGGSGVTPFVSIMREAAYLSSFQKLSTDYSLLVSYRSRNDLILYSELQRLKDIPHLQVLITLTRDKDAGDDFWQGRISPEILTNFTAKTDFKKTIFMSCGPTAMMDTVTSFLKDRDVPEEHIMSESFES